MYTELIQNISADKIKFNIWSSFLEKADLKSDLSVGVTVLLWNDDDILVATGSRDGNVLKCIAVSEKHQGEGLMSIIITELKKDAFSQGIRHLFLYTKPQNKLQFSDLFFYPVAQTDFVLLMENQQNGISKFLNELPTCESNGTKGCVVMNCNPFTLGHQYLIETASTKCDTLYVFVVSEDKSMFSADDRIEMVRLGTKHINNVCVLPTGPYLISSVSFPTYFLKDRENFDKIKCGLDIEIFLKHYVSKFNIKKRFVGTEPLSQMTNQYNEELKKYLPENEVELEEIPRLEISSAPVSATRVRELINLGDKDKIKDLLPDTTYNYLISKGLI